MTEPIHRFSDGEVYFWIEAGTSIHLKSITPQGDPVELSADEAREIATQLLECAEKLERN